MTRMSKDVNAEIRDTVILRVSSTVAKLIEIIIIVLADAACKLLDGPLSQINGVLHWARIHLATSHIRFHLVNSSCLYCTLFTTLHILHMYPCITTGWYLIPFFNYVSQITLWDILFSPCPCFLATPMCYIPFERVFDVD